MKFKVKLRLIDSNGKKHKYSLNLEEGSKFTLGRGTPGIGVELNHPTVSTAHCHLHVKDGVLNVLDNKSRNGTRLNGKSIQTAQVRVGDMLQLGVCQLEFLEAPNPPVEENPAHTRFLDVNEMSPEERKAMGKPVPDEERAPEPTMAMSRKGVDEVLNPNTGNVALEREGTSPGMQTLASQLQQSGAAQNAPESQNSPLGYDNDAYSSPSSGEEVNTDEAPISSEMTQQMSSEGAPSIPNRPNFEEPHQDDGLFRSPESFGRGREGEYRREDDPRYNPDARNRRGVRESTRESRKPAKVADRATDTISRPKASRKAGGIDQHLLISALIALVANAAAGTLLSMGKETYAPWVTPVAGIAGVVLSYALAWLLHKYNEFMEAEGSVNDYFRFLAYSTVAFVPTSLLTNTAMMWRLAAFIGLGIAFFHLFMAKFRPVAEKFVFLVASYVSILAFAGYLVNGRNGATAQGTSRERKPKVAVKQPEEEREPAQEKPVEKPVEKQDPTENPQEDGEPTAENEDGDESPAPTQAAQPTKTPEVQAAQVQPQKIEAPTETKQPSKQPNKPGGPDSFAISQLYKAAEHGDSDIVRKLIRDKGVNPNTVAENGVTALMLAAYYGHVETARFLLGEKADINLKDRQGTTALMWAVLKGNREMVAVLVQAGADLNARRNDGDTALEIARMWHYNEIVRILDKNAKVSSDDRGNARKPSSQPRRAPSQQSRKTSSKSPPKKSKPARKKNSRFSATEND